MVFQPYRGEVEREENDRRQPPSLSSIYRSFDELRQWVCIGFEGKRLGE
jgi:hypothetical protein